MSALMQSDLQTDEVAKLMVINEVTSQVGEDYSTSISVNRERVKLSSTTYSVKVVLAKGRDANRSFGTMFRHAECSSRFEGLRR